MTCLPIFVGIFSIKLPDSSEVLLGRFLNGGLFDRATNLGDVDLVSEEGDTLTIESNFTADLIPFGQRIFFFLKTFRKNGTGSFNSSDIPFKTPGSKVTDFDVKYDSIDLLFRWEQKTDEDLIENYRVERLQGEIIQKVTIEAQQFLATL